MDRSGDEMTTAIWKFPFVEPGEFFIAMPRLFRPLCVQLQDGVPTLWALVNPLAKKEHWKFKAVGTGHAFDPAGWYYIATWQEGMYVWHLFGPEPTL